MSTTTVDPRDVERAVALPRWRGLEPVGDRVAPVRESLLARAGPTTGLLDPAELEKRLERLPAYDRSRPYAQLKPFLAAADAELCHSYGERAALHVALGVLVHLIASHASRWANERLDPELRPEFVDSFHRILDAAERGGSSALRMNRDNYAKDLAICLFRLIPCGGQLVDPGAGVPRSILLRPPLASLPRKGWYLLVTCGGFVPFAELHTHERMRHLFTRDGWEYCFRRLPAVFRSYPRLKGVFGASWFFDPQLASISPALSFVRDVSERWGGLIVRDRPDAGATANALAMSEERRALHAQGRYRPINYFMVAAKSRILDRAHALATGQQRSHS
jgi:hypothetical protein